MTWRRDVVGWGSKEMEHYDYAERDEVIENPSFARYIIVNSLSIEFIIRIERRRSEGDVEKLDFGATTKRVRIGGRRTTVIKV